MFLNLLLISLATSFSVFLGQSYQSSQNFHSKSQSLSNFDTMSLAASSRVSKESNQFLLDLQTYLNNSIKAKSQGQTTNQEKLREIFNNYLKKINPSETNQLSETIKFVINQDTQAKDISYTAQLLNSSFLPAKLSETTPSYISTLITKKQIERFVDLNTLNNFYKGSNLIISSELISTLIDPQDYKTIMQNPSQFGLEISSQGLGIVHLPNGILIELIVENES
ncbi:MAG: hypothetical protein RLZZ361_1415 [Cyanobacteriota bacterium]|jgi:hypothetical protein